MGTQARYASVALLERKEKRVAAELKFRHVCKNSGFTRTCDLSEFAHKNSKLASLFIISIYRKRNAVGVTTWDTYVAAIRRFFRYLESKGMQGMDPSEITILLLEDFARSLKEDARLAYSTARQCFGTIRIVLRGGGYAHLLQGPSPLKKAFKGARRMNNSVAGYQSDEFRKLLRHTLDAVREADRRLLPAYKPKWINRVPPYGDIAPIAWRRDGSFYLLGRFASEAYRIWWWETTCKAQPLTAEQIRALPGGSSFLRQLRADKGRTSSVALTSFYRDIKAGSRYQLRYPSGECPLKYDSPYESSDYMQWFWENRLDMMRGGQREIARKDPHFIYGLQKHHGGMKFFDSLGVVQTLFLEDLIPYYLLLLAITALNPTTIQSLTIDCLKQDPTDPQRWMIEWTKLRAFKKGRTIPAIKAKDSAPEIISRVLKVTAPFRKNEKQLWICGMNSAIAGVRPRRLSPQAFNRALQRFVESWKAELTARGQDAGDIPHIEPRRFRPTIATHEYLRTEDLAYIQSLLGHTNFSTTAAYITSVGDPVLRSRRGVHQQAMFLGLTEVDCSPQESDEDHSHVAEPAEALLNHCSDPEHSPYTGQRAGVVCSAPSDCCLSCQNLVITHDDIHKHFSYVRYHEMLVERGKLTASECSAIIGEKKFVWENQILPRYSQGLVEHYRKLSITQPVREWDSNLRKEGEL